MHATVISVSHKRKHPEQGTSHTTTDSKDEPPIPISISISDTTVLPAKMRLSIPATLGALAALLGVSIAHNIQLGAHSRECFHEQLHADDKMTVSFQVGDREFGGSGNLEIDFWVSSLLFSRGNGQ